MEGLAGICPASQLSSGAAGSRLFREDQKHFDQIVDAGRQYFFGPEGNADNLPEVWLHRLVEAVAGCMEADSPMGPLGYPQTWEQRHFATTNSRIHPPAD